MILTTLILAIPQPVLAGTTTADFLKWEKEAQESFFSTSILMATFIAMDVRPEVAQCLNELYFKNLKGENEFNNRIRNVMAKNSDHHPSIIILASIEKECGTFKKD